MAHNEKKKMKMEKKKTLAEEMKQQMVGIVNLEAQVQILFSPK